MHTSTTTFLYPPFFPIFPSRNCPLHPVALDSAFNSQPVATRPAPHLQPVAGHSAITPIFRPKSHNLHPIAPLKPNHPRRQSTRPKGVAIILRFFGWRYQKRHSPTPTSEDLRLPPPKTRPPQNHSEDLRAAISKNAPVPKPEPRTFSPAPADPHAPSPPRHPPYNVPFPPALKLVRWRAGDTLFRRTHG